MLWLRLLGTWPKRRLLSESSDVSMNLILMILMVKVNMNVTWKMFKNMETVLTPLKDFAKEATTK